MQFNEVFEDRTKYGTKIKTDEYQAQGKNIIVDQGQALIAGYTDKQDGLFTDVPAIVFGDHTRVVKYIDQPFFLGADGVKVLKCKLPDANYKYLYYTLQNAKIPNTGYNRHFKWLKELDIYYPTKEAQKSIATILGSVSTMISLRNQQLKKLDELVKAKFAEMFLKQLPAVVLGDVIETVSGGTPSSKKREYYEGGTIPWLTSGEINRNQIFYTENHITEEGLKNSSAKWVPKDSVVVAMYGATAGKAGILRIPATTNQAVCTLIPNDNFDPYYLYYAVKSREKWMVENRSGAAQPNISQAIIKKMKLTCAPINEQKRFAAFAAQVDKSKAAVQSALDKAQLLFDSLMQKYFG